MNFCSKCGSDQMEFAIPMGDNRKRHSCIICGTIHYQNPKIIVGCLPVWEDKVLLCRRSIEPRAGYWNVPGGFMENGETVEQGAAREVLEEAEAVVENMRLHAVYNLPIINQVYLHYVGDLKNGAFGVGEESLESKLFTQDEIDWHGIAFASSTFTLKTYFADRARGKFEVHTGEYNHGRVGG